MLNEYNHLRQEKEEEKRRMRVRTIQSYDCIFLGSSLICLSFEQHIGTADYMIIVLLVYDYWLKLVFCSTGPEENPGATHQ